MGKGKGSERHRKLQKDISALLRKMGYLVIIEPAFDGRNADLLVQDIESMKTTIIEIELHKNYRHAIQSIYSDLRFSNEVIVLCSSTAILQSLRRRVKQIKDNNKKIHFVPINQYIEFIRTLFQNKNNNKIHNKTQNKIRTKLRSELIKEVIGVNIKKKGNKLHY